MALIVLVVIVLLLAVVYITLYNGLQKGRIAGFTAINVWDMGRRHLPRGL